jgi:hypothetical protein
MKLKIPNLDNFVKELKNRGIITIRSACFIRNTPLKDTSLTTEMVKLSALSSETIKSMAQPIIPVPIIIEFELEIHRDLTPLFYNSEEYKKAHTEKVSKIMELLKKENINILDGYYEE